MTLTFIFFPPLDASTFVGFMSYSQQKLVMYTHSKKDGIYVLFLHLADFLYGASTEPHILISRKEICWILSICKSSSKKISWELLITRDNRFLDDSNLGDIQRKIFLAIHGKVALQLLLMISWWVIYCPLAQKDENAQVE